MGSGISSKKKYFQSSLCGFKRDEVFTDPHLSFTRWRALSLCGLRLGFGTYVRWTLRAKSLQDKSLIQITADSADSRKKIIVVTKKGQRLQDRAKDIPKTLLCMLGGDKANPSELDLLKSMLDELNRAIASIE